MLNNVMILAAGKGERLRPLTQTCHKALLPLPGGSTLERLLNAFQDATRVVVNTHHLADHITNAVLKARPDAVLSFEHSLLDSGGAVRHALHYFNEPFWIANSDILGDITLMRQTLAHSWQGYEGMRLLLIPTPQGFPGDYDQDNQGLLSAQKGGPFTVAGLHIAQPWVYQSYPDGSVFSHTDVWKSLEQKKQLYGTVFEGSWLDIGTHERLALTGFTLQP